MSEVEDLRAELTRWQPLRDECERYRAALEAIRTPVAPIHDQTALQSWRIAHVALKPSKAK